MLDFGMSSNDCLPKCIVIISGKRKAGKDYVADLLLNRYSKSVCTILRLSGPLKKQYAEEHGLNYEELLKASAYKEKYRADMIKWGEEKRNREPYFFCSKTVEVADHACPFWIISDARRQTDIQYFRENYPSISLFLRVEADESIRKQRGFVFTPGIDNAESECGLDMGVDWDFVLHNNGNHSMECTDSFKNICSHIDTRLKRNSV